MSAVAAELDPLELADALFIFAVSEGNAEADADFIILLESDFPEEPLVDSDSDFADGFTSLGFWKGFDSDLDFSLSFSFEDLSEDSDLDEEPLFDEEDSLFDDDDEDDDDGLDESELFEDEVFDCSGLPELDFEDSVLDEADVFEVSDLDPVDFEESDFWELDFDWPDKLAAKLASPLKGLAELEESLLEEVL